MGKQLAHSALKIAIATGFAICAFFVLPPFARAQDANTFSTIQRGLYLSRVGDCAACHSEEGKSPFAGNVPLATPFGTIYSSNLTPDENHGIGSWDKNDFYRAMTQGINKNGQRLYPAFPYPHFTIITKEDSDSIFAYLSSLEPSSQSVAPPQFRWPLNWRKVMAGWNLINFKPHDFTEDHNKSAEWNRGKYLVEGLGHCALCHSPKNIIGAEKDGPLALSGGLGEGWYAPSLRRGNGGEGLMNWSSADLAEYLKNGRNTHSAAFGAMSEVIEKSTSFMNDADISAIVAYLKDLPGDDKSAPPAKTTRVAADDPQMRNGSVVFQSQCSACHGLDGKGIPHQFGSLAGSSLAQAKNTTTLIRLTLEGGKSAATDKYPTPQAMPSFAWKLNDAQIADVLTYVRNNFGNAAAPVSAQEVSAIRRDLHGGS